ncbi:MAG: hypothetical protein ACLFWM_05425 [Actinomycetota bacterium]
MRDSTKARRSVIVTGILVAMAILGASTAGASHSFLDVPEDHLFHGDIEWMRDNGITRGCNPPANTNYCAEDYTTRGQMAAFFHRFAQAGVVDADTLDGLDSTDFLTKEEAEELEGVPGPQGPAGEMATDNVTVREGAEGSGLIVVGNSYTAMCEPGEIALGGGFDADFTLVDLADLELPILGDTLGLIVDVADLQSALDGVSSVNISSSRPAQNGDQFGWTIETTTNAVSNVTVSVVCAG